MTQRDTRIAQIEIAYVPKRGKDQAVRDALTDAIGQVFEEQFGDLVDGASSAFRFLPSARKVPGRPYGRLRAPALPPTSDVPPVVALPCPLTARQLAAQIGISEWMVYDWASKGMPTVKVGRASRWDPGTVRAWIAGGGTANGG